MAVKSKKRFLMSFRKVEEEKEKMRVIFYYGKLHIIHVNLLAVG